MISILESNVGEKPHQYQTSQQTVQVYNYKTIEIKQETKPLPNKSMKNPAKQHMAQYWHRPTITITYTRCA